jgi:hypothetical protein
MEAHLKITDFSCITKVHSIWRVRGPGTLSSMFWRRSNPKPNKVRIYTKMGYQLDEKKPLEQIWALEERTG